MLGEKKLGVSLIKKKGKKTGKKEKEKKRILKVFSACHCQAIHPEPLFYRRLSDSRGCDGADGENRRRTAVSPTVKSLNVTFRLITPPPQPPTPLPVELCGKHESSDRAVDDYRFASLPCGTMFTKGLAKVAQV